MSMTLRRDAPAPRASDPVTAVPMSCAVASVRSKDLPGASTLRAALVAATTLAYAWAIHVGVMVFGPLFPYLSYRSPDRLLYAGGLTLAVASSLILPRRLHRASDTALWIIQVSVVLPAIVCAHVLGLLTPAEAFIFSVHVVGAMTVARLITMALPRVNLPTGPRRSSRAIWVAMMAYAVAIYLLLVVVAGARPTYVGVLDVYGLRSEFDAKLAPIPFMGYLLPLLHNVVNPLLATRGIFARNWLLLGFGLGGQVLVFLLAGQKGVLFSTLFLVGFAFLFRGIRLPSGSLLQAGLAVATFAALLFDRLTGTLYAGSVFVRRFLILPGALVVAYTSIFTSHAQTLFGDSVLRFLGNPYAQGPAPAHIVGLEYIGHAETNANVSFLGHGYLSWGYPGMYVEAAVVGLMLWAIDLASRGLPAKVCALLMVMPTVTLSSASAFTSILTHGLAGLVVILLIVPRSGWASPPRRRPLGWTSVAALRPRGHTPT